MKEPSRSDRTTLGELRAALAHYPDSYRVLVDGYEAGLERPVIRLEVIRPVPIERQRPWRGPLEEVGSWDAGEIAIVIGRDELAL